MKFSSVILSSFLIFSAVLNSAYGEPKLRMQLQLNHTFKKQQLPKNLDVAGQDLKKGTVDIIGSREYFEILRDQGLPIRIVDQQTKGLDSRYLTPQKIVALIQQLAGEFPNLIHVEKIGSSLQGRPILALRVSTKENLESKPAILFNGMHHAREIMTTEVTTDIITYLVKNYDNPETPWVTAWLEHLAIWVIPQVNPDGNNIVWQADNWWRKNARMIDEKIFGVDLNRNYPFQWGTCYGSSGNPGDQTYRGAKAASEPETQAIMSLVKRENMAMDVSYHSYSELVIAPYGCQNQFTPENFILQDIGKGLANRLKTDDGNANYTYGTGWELLYPVDGEDISWMYNEVNTMAYVIEVNSGDQGFQPNYDKWRNKTVLGQRAGWTYMISRLQNGPQVRGRMFDARTGTPVEGSVLLSEVKYRNEKARKSKNGFYQKLLAPGSYELVFSSPGYESQSIALSVDNAAVVQDVYFEKKD